MKGSPPEWQTSIEEGLQRAPEAASFCRLLSLCLVACPWYLRTHQAGACNTGTHTSQYFQYGHRNSGERASILGICRLNVSHVPVWAPGCGYEDGAQGQEPSLTVSLHVRVVGKEAHPQFVRYGLSVQATCPTPQPQYDAKTSERQTVPETSQGAALFATQATHPRLCPVATPHTRTVTCCSVACPHPCSTWTPGPQHMHSPAIRQTNPARASTA